MTPLRKLLMTKLSELSEKDQDWFDRHDHGAFYRDDVEELLIQKDAEHKAEIAELKEQLANHNRLRVFVEKHIENYEGVASMQAAILVLKRGLDASKTSLSQHDKQVTRNALLDFSVYMRYQGHSLANPVYNDLAEYINQIKEQ